MRVNPLVHFTNQSGETPRTAWEILAPLLAPSAPEAFTRVYTKVPINIGIVLRPEGWNGQAYEEGARDAAARRDFRADLHLAQTQQCLLLVIEAESRAPSKRAPRGDPARASAMTPFATLHRVADEVVDLEIPAVERTVLPLIRALDRAARKVRIPRGRRAEVESRGVDTAAGRMGVLSGPGPEASGQAFADLFASWMITGRVRYSPTEPPSLYPGEDEYRRLRAEVYPKLLRAILEVLRRRGHTPFYLLL